MAESALDGVRVLDLTHHIAGPYCTKLLADFGADVVKIERPGSGDPARGKGPFFHDQDDGEKSLLFLYLNTNKRSVTVDLKSEPGKEIVRKLARSGSEPESG
ncbi:MAG: CoA transferase [Chloroflexi bacterium]|nr:CoA transferase [Chloroflexota bacterium]